MLSHCGEHLLEAFLQRVSTGLPRALSVSRINAVQYFATRVRVRRELDKQRTEDAAMMLFLGVFEIEIEIRYGGWSGVILSGNILDDRRAF